MASMSCEAANQGNEGALPKMSSPNMVRNRSRKRLGIFLKITRLLAQAVLYQPEPNMPDPEFLGKA
jgi:hypothetical protein